MPGQPRASHIEVTNPITGAMIGSVPNSTPEQVFGAIERARVAQPAWEARGARGRARLLRLWADAIFAGRDDLAAVIRRETGKHAAGAMIEVLLIDTNLEYYAKLGPRLLRPQRRRVLFPVLQYGRVYYRPYGVVGFITPWNYPLLNGVQDAIPALAAGNTVILKPSEITPFAVLRAVELAHRAGIPRDVLQVVTGDGTTGAALVDGVDMIALTGSTATGRKVAARAAERLIPYSLELGGKDPAIVLDDVLPDDAARATIQGALENAGQTCVSVERVYALDSIHDRYVERLQIHLDQLKFGNGGGLDVEMASMTNEREICRTEAHIADARAKGARLLHGGQRRPDLGPLFFEPTLLVDVNHTMDVMRDETFGPIIAVQRVHSVDEAVRLANDSCYGLSSTVLGRDLRRAEQVAQRLVAGDTSINRPQWILSAPTLPMGGRKESGVGRRGGPEGLLRFVTTHSIIVDRGLLRNPRLHQLDPTIHQVIVWLRPLRRWLPWLWP